MKIINIKTEYLINPIGIGIRNPRINWNLEGVEKQESFEIKYVVNGKEKTSGEIISSSMHYDFNDAFSSRDRVQFKIIVKSEGETVSSEENLFEIGLLNMDDWKASWISADMRPSKKERYPVDCFKREFNASDIEKARLYVSAHGLYEVRINGKKVGTFVLAPGSTDYRKRTQYQTYDCLDLIKNGENSIEIELADGWYRGSIGARGNTHIFGSVTSVIAQLELTDSNGKVSYVNTDSSYKWSNDGAIRFADLKDGETVDFNMSPSYGGQARIIKVKENLTASNNTFIEEMESFEPLRVFKSPKGRTILEFKQNLAGILSFKAKARKNDRIQIVMGEILDKDGEVTLSNIQLPNNKRVTPMQEINVTCKEGINEYHGKFTISGFRYAQVISDCEVYDFRQIALYSRLEETSSFESSNELINTFVKNTLWSLKSNSADVPTDCPTRERMGWTGDSQVFFNTASYLTNYAAFSRKHIVDVFDRQDKNGRLPQIAPYNAEDWYMDTMNGSVGWADVGVLIPYRYYIKYGDDRMLREYYDRMVDYANFMIRRVGRVKGIYAIYAKPLGLSKENVKFQVNNGQSYGEWAEPNDVCAFSWKDFAAPHPEESMAYTSFILNLMVKIGDILGRHENDELFTKYSEGVKKAYQELVTLPAFSLDTNRQAKLVRPLYMNLLTDEQREFAKKRLVEALDWYKWRLGTGFLSTPFILEVLSGIDPEYAYRLLENEEMPGWLYMAKNDTGTIWEGWEGPNSQAGIASLNHYSKGAMVEWLFNGMCGINITGENRFVLSPIVGGRETYAKASYNSIYGTVGLSWKKADGKVEFDIIVPSNTTATFKFGDFEKELKGGTYTFTL